MVVFGSAADLERDMGGKAAGLVALERLGAPVPPFGVIPTALFHQHLERGEIPAALGRTLMALGRLDPDTHQLAQRLSGVADGLREAIVAAGATEDLRRAVAATLDEVGEGPYAVRSSMVGEDSARTSFAGQLDSYLFRRDADEVLDGVLRCWASAFGERALAYAIRVGLAPAAISMGVVVQRMVGSDAAGVLFTVNPAGERRDQCMVSAAYGLGEGVVSGLAETDEYLWSPHAGEQSATVADKHLRVIRAPDGRGTEQAAVPPQARGRRVLSEEQVGELCELGLRIAAASGRPMDVEWAYADGEAHVLQARPITSLRPAPDATGPRRVYDNSNIQESYNGVTTPLTFSFASRAYTTVFRQLVRTLGVSRRALAEFEPDARTLIGLVRGRVYYNLASWDRLYSLLPRSEQNKRSLATVMLHTEMGWETGASTAAAIAGVRRGAELAAVGARFVYRFATLDRDIERFLAHFHSVYDAVDRPGLAHASLHELFETSQRLYADLLDNWDPPNINDLRVLMTSGHLRGLLERYFDANEVDFRLADLLGGIEGIESVEPTRRLVSIAADVRRDSRLVDALAAAGPARAMAELRRLSPALAARLDDYVARYGDRCIGELKLETTTLRDDPAFLVEVLRNYVGRPELDPDRLSRSERERFERTLADLRRRLPRWRRRMLDRELGLARRAVKAREATRLRRTLAFGLARDIYRAMGMRLHEAGVLEDPRDVDYLTVDELEAFVEGRAASVELGPIAAARNAEYARYADDDVANRIETIGSPYVGNELLAPAREIESDGTLRGLGCCAGVVEGPVRVIFDARDELSVNGKILCTIRTDPGWAPLFPTASGLIVERGSALSHSAVVAREFGIPTVVGVPDVTRILSDGDEVRLDGSSGVIERISRSEIRSGETAATS